MANPSKPILTQYVGGVLVEDKTPQLKFVIPTDLDADMLVFRIELDKNSTINSSSSYYRKFESRLSQGTWTYWNGTSYVELPEAGVKQEHYGNEAIFEVPEEYKLDGGFWYWRVSCSDKISCSSFGNGIFGQKKLCAGT